MFVTLLALLPKTVPDLPDPTPRSLATAGASHQFLLGILGGGAARIFPDSLLDSGWISRRTDMTLGPSCRLVMLQLPAIRFGLLTGETTLKLAAGA